MWAIVYRRQFVTNANGNSDYWLILYNVKHYHGSQRQQLSTEKVIGYFYTFRREWALAWLRIVAYKVNYERQFPVLIFHQ